jgi:microcystin-dependent protein
MPTFDGNLALFQENAGNVYNAIEFRRQFQAHTNTRAGVLRDNDFACAVVGTNVVVQTGSAYVSDTGGTSFGYYFARTVDDATTAPAVPITPNFTGGARTDIVTLRILDTARGDGSNNCSIVYEVNTTVSVFARSLVLFQLVVANGGTTVTSSTDRRQFAGTYQGITRCTTAGRPLSPSIGDAIYDTTTSTIYTWSGSAWVASGSPVGTLVSTVATVAPAGWLLCNGQTIASGATVYPDLWAIAPVVAGSITWGRSATSLIIPDLRGRTVAGVDNMGGVAANRVTASSGVAGTTLSAVGGNELLASHTHPYGDYYPNGGFGVQVGGSFTAFVYNLLGDAARTTGGAGSGGSQNVQPTMMLNYIIKL